MCSLLYVFMTVTDLSDSGRIVKDHETRNGMKLAEQHKTSIQNFIARPLVQQQAALNLARLANKEEDIGLTEGKLDVLLLTLTVRLLPVPHLRCFDRPR